MKTLKKKKKVEPMEEKPIKKEEEKKKPKMKVDEPSNKEYVEKWQPQLDFCAKVVSDITLKGIDSIVENVSIPEGPEYRREYALKRVIEILHKYAAEHMEETAKKGKPKWIETKSTT